MVCTDLSSREPHRQAGMGRVMLVCLLLFYTIVTIFQSYQGGDMMHEMRRRKRVHALLPTQGIFNLPHHIGMV